MKRPSNNWQHINKTPSLEDSLATDMNIYDALMNEPRHSGVNMLEVYATFQAEICLKHGLTAGEFTAIYTNFYQPGGLLDPNPAFSDINRHYWR